jgi:hypothetical protein
MKYFLCLIFFVSFVSAQRLTPTDSADIHAFIDSVRQARQVTLVREMQTKRVQKQIDSLSARWQADVETRKTIRYENNGATKIEDLSDAWRDFFVKKYGTRIDSLRNLLGKQ